MPTPASLHRKIQSAEDLQSIVKTMKALAATNIRQYENAVVALKKHSHALDLALQIVMINYPKAIATQPVPPRRIGIVAFGSDQGMCGQFNERLAEFIATRLEKQNDPHTPAIIAVGDRLADRLTATGWPIARGLSIPGSLNGVTPLVQTLVLQLEAWQTANHIDHIWTIYNRPGTGAVPHPILRQLFPLSTLYLQKLAQQAWPSRCRPQLLTDIRKLFSALFQQHFFIGLYRACAESLASENITRLISMQTAEKNIEERLFDLKAAFQQQRQDIITEELLDIISGFEALSGD
ncbi:MAG: F0F1 ATP synthase subunit gamma [Elainellaceae cyanobacterium]